MLVDTDGLLIAIENDDPTIAQVPSWRKFSLAAGAPIGICWHYTAGATPHDIEAVRRIRDLNPLDQRSWHLWLSQEGPIMQSVPLIKGSWHVRRRSPKTPAWAKGGINRWLIGIELESKDGTEFTDPQLHAADKLIGALRCWHPEWPIEAFEWGHSDFDPPPRRFDPGPVWRFLLPGLLARHFKG